MRQRLLMFFAPNKIAHVDIAAAQRAAREMLGLGSQRPADLLADDGAAWPRFVDIHDGCHWAPFKKNQPSGFPKGQFPYGAGLHPTVLPSLI
jgi:hypothetical protein